MVNKRASNNVKVLTSKGFKKFDSVVSRGIRKTICIHTSVADLTCTPDHRIMLSTGEFVEALFVEPGDILRGGITIESVETTKNQEVFDFVNVEDTHNYVSNGIVSHNCNVLICDEFAFLPPNMADEFIASVFPTLSSSKESKLVLISTPNGIGNAFHKIWKESEDGINNFVRIQGKWQESRSQEWYEEQCKVLGDKAKIAAELDCQFAGSAHTLIEQSAINVMVNRRPLKDIHNVRIFEPPHPDHKYTMVVDVARGHGLDYSAFSIIDTTRMPFNVVCTFKDNDILPAQLSLLCYQYGQMYNEACILIESNDLGEAVAQTLWYDLEYGNIIWTDNNNNIRGGGRIGVRTTKSVKASGLSRLKDLVENNLLIVNDGRIIEELQIFVLQKSGQYGASNTKINDDLTATLWLFGWLTKQSYFEELCTASVNATITNRFREEMEDYVPVGFRDTGKEWHETPRLSDDERELLGYGASSDGLRGSFDDVF